MSRPRGERIVHQPGFFRDDTKDITYDLVIYADVPIRVGQPNTATIAYGFLVSPAEHRRLFVEVSTLPTYRQMRRMCEEHVLEDASIASFPLIANDTLRLNLPDVCVLGSLYYSILTARALSCLAASVNPEYVLAAAQVRGRTADRV